MGGEQGGSYGDQDQDEDDSKADLAGPPVGDQIPAGLIPEATDAPAFGSEIKIRRDRGRRSSCGILY
jgi:hypothetical protein